MSATNTTITLPKQDLIDRLKDRRNKVAAECWAAEVLKEIQDAIQEVRSQGALLDRLRDWHKAIHDGILAGTITLDGKGALRGAPPKPKQGAITGVRSHRRNYDLNFVGWDLPRLLEAEKDYQQRVDETCQELDSAIDLLNISTDAEVTINVADYQRMLSGRIR